VKAPFSSEDDCMLKTPECALQLCLSSCLCYFWCSRSFQSFGNVLTSIQQLLKINALLTNTE